LENVSIKYNTGKTRKGGTDGKIFCSRKGTNLNCSAFQHLICSLRPEGPVIFIAMSNVSVEIEDLKKLLAELIQSQRDRSAVQDTEARFKDTDAKFKETDIASKRLSICSKANGAN
jgi:hypothetical protein